MKVRIEAEASFNDLLTAMDAYVKDAPGDVFSLWEAQKLRAIAEAIVLKVKVAVEQQCGVKLDADDLKILDKQPSDG